MKKLTLLFVLAFILQGIGYSQSCLPEGIVFETQTQIDSFQINHPDCTEIEGSVYIGEWDPTDTIINLNGLSVLTSIGGDLKIGGTGFWEPACFFLQNLDGLTNLIEIGGELKIVGCHSLQNLAGLENLSSIGGWLFIGVFNLGNGFFGNSSLSSLSGLENLTSISGGISIVDNNSLTSLSGIDNIILNSIDDLIIMDNDILSTCAVQSICDYLAAPSGNIWIQYNDTGCNTQQEVEVACETVSIEEVSIVGGITMSPTLHHLSNPVIRTATAREGHSEHIQPPWTIDISVTRKPIKEQATAYMEC